jgi:SAM-dependent methyltransferase
MLEKQKSGHRLSNLNPKDIPAINKYQTMSEINKRITELNHGYNFPDDPYANVFMSVLHEAFRVHNEQVTGLDIGCGEGIFLKPDYQRQLKPYLSEFIGVEPDPSVQPEEGIFDSVHHCLMEDAPIAPASVDVAYAALVVEHVQDPVAFLKSIHRALKPGGVFLFCTPNLKSYFGRMCWLTKSLGIDEWLLRKIRKTEVVEEYHYPIAYKLNDAIRIQEACDKVGLIPTIVYTEHQDACRMYFPKPFRPIYHLLKWKRKVYHKKECLTHLIVELRKPVEPAKRVNA